MCEFNNRDTYFLSLAMISIGTHENLLQPLNGLVA